MSCLGKLSCEIGVCIEVYHSFVGESCIRECAVVYDGILMRSLSVFFTALGILSTQSTLYADSYGSTDLISGMAFKLYLILENIALVITTSISFLSSSSIQNLYVLMLEVVC